MQKKLTIQKWIYVTSLLCLFLIIFGGFCPIVKAESGDVAVIFTNDIHGGVDQNIGYAGLAAYKKELEQQYNNHVITVDCGDHLQGSSLALMSLGSEVTEIMNKVGYDYATFGNHEFDYKIPNLKSIMAKFKGEYLCCNLKYTGNASNPFATLKPYAIKECNGLKVGFIGVTTPNAMKSSSPVYFKEDDKLVYDFCGGHNGEDLYRVVQENADACRQEGADFVVVLSHLGIAEEDAPYRSTDLIANTTGIDVVLDGHSHSVINETVNNKEGQKVYLAQTGTELNKIGKLVLNKDNTPRISLELVSEYPSKDQALDEYIKSRQSLYEETLKQEIGNATTALPIYDENGVRVVRSRECGMGNLVADAYRIRTGAEIGLVIGGSIRVGFNVGKLKLEDALLVTPFVNYLYVVKLKGKDLLDVFEYYYKDVKTEYVKDGKAFGEFGSFIHISGVKLKVDATVPPTILLNSDGNFAGVGENRRVRDVQVLINGQYEPLNPEKTYTVASTDYILFGGGDGMGDYLADRVVEVIFEEDSHLIYQDLGDYIKENLNGDVSAYAQTEGRIIVTQHICSECAERVNEKKPTEKETGYTGDLQCKYCHTILEKGQIIPINERDQRHVENVRTGIDADDDYNVSLCCIFAAISISVLLLISRRKSDY